MQNEQKGSATQKRTQSELDSIIKQGKWNSQSDANRYLQPFGLHSQLRDNGTVEIFEGADTASARVATVTLQGTSADQQTVKQITY
jgi:hypothetical protein